MNATDHDADTEQAEKRRPGRQPVSTNRRLISGKVRTPGDTWYPTDGQLDRLKWHAARIAGPDKKPNKAPLVRDAVAAWLEHLDREAGVDTTGAELPPLPEQES